MKKKKKGRLRRVRVAGIPKHCTAGEQKQPVQYYSVPGLSKKALEALSKDTSVSSTIVTDDRLWEMADSVAQQVREEKGLPKNVVSSRVKRRLIYVHIARNNFVFMTLVS